MRTKLINRKKIKHSSLALLLSAGMTFSSALPVVAREYNTPGENVTEPISGSERLEINYGANDTPAVQSGNISGGVNDGLSVFADNNGTLWLRGDNTGYLGSIIFVSGTLNLADSSSLFGNMGNFIFEANANQQVLPTLQINTGADILLDSGGTRVQRLNVGRVNGGNIHLMPNSTLTWQNNLAADMGGTIFVGTFGILDLQADEGSRYIFRQNAASDGGVARIYEGTLQIDKADLLNNSATTSRGGAIYIEQGSGNAPGTVTITQATFAGNSAQNYGGAIYSSGGEINLINTDLTGNSATSWSGGAIYNSLGTTTIDQGTLQNNSANRDGGAIYQQGGVLNLTQADFVDNLATGGYGGAIRASTISSTDVTTHILNSNFTNNSALSDGGAIYNSSANLTGAVAELVIAGTAFTGNKSTSSSGGAIYNHLSRLTVSGSSFADNYAYSTGGAIRNSNYLSVQDSTFANNSSRSHGGAIHNYYNSTLNNVESSFENVTFRENSAGSGGRGGAIYNQDARLTLQDTSFLGNTAGWNGGAVLAWNGDVALIVSGGQTSTYAGNRDSSGSNSFFFSARGDKSTDFYVQVDSDGTLDMLDPMLAEVGDSFGRTGSITIRKQSPGTWKLGGASKFRTTGTSPGNTFINISEGTLALYRKGEVPNGNGLVDAGAIHLEGVSSNFSLGAGNVARLEVNGGNAITVTDNANNFASAAAQGEIVLGANPLLSFDAAYAQITEPMLFLKADNITVNGTLSVDLRSLPGSGTYTLVHKQNNTGSDFNAGAGGNVSLLLTLRGKAIADTRGTTSGFTITTPNVDEIVLTQNIVNEVVNWTGASNPTWDMTTANNWLNDLSAASTKYMLGDIVNFDGTDSIPTTIAIDSEGVDVAGMYISGNKNYTFTGGSITANQTGTSLTGAAVNGKLVLGRRAGQNDAAGSTSVSGSDFTGTLDFTGITGENQFRQGIDIYSGSLRVASAKQLGTTLANLHFLSSADQANLIFAGETLFDGAGSSWQRLSVASGNTGKTTLEGSGSLTVQNNTSAQNGAAVFVDTAATLTMTSGNPLSYTFQANKSGAAGGAIYNQGSLTLSDAVLTNNKALNGWGGAIYSSGVLNLQVNKHTLFAGNLDNSGANAIHLQAATNNAQLNINTATGASLDMQDPMRGNASGSAQNIINKTGAGTWLLGGQSNFTGSTLFNVKEGILHLYGSNETSGVAAGKISLTGSASRFTLGDGASAARLVVGGENSIAAEGGVLLNNNSTVQAGGAAQGINKLQLSENTALQGNVYFEVAAGRTLELDTSLSGGTGTFNKTGAGDLIFNRGGNYIDSLNVQAGMLGLAAGEQVNITANNVVFAPGTGLNISGFNGSSYGEYQTLIQSATVIDNVPRSFVAGQVNSDFLSAQLVRSDDGKALGATVGLTWYNPSTLLAHGSFTITGEKNFFELGTVLADRQGVFPSRWDGRSLDKRNSGTLRLTAANTYSGNTIIEAGTLAITKLTGTGVNKADKNVLLNGTLQLDIASSEQGQYNKRIAGLGNLRKTGSGLVELTADNQNFTGEVFVEQGALLATNENALGKGNVDNAAAIVLAFDGIFSNNVKGSGLLVTDGQISLTGNHTSHTGLTEVSSGRLTLGGENFYSQAGYLVGSNAMLAGNGTVGNLLINTGGVISPGNSLGSITSTGNARFSPGSLFIAEVDTTSGQSDYIETFNTTTIEQGAAASAVIRGGFALARGQQDRYLLVKSNTFTDQTVFDLSQARKKFFDLSQEFAADENGQYLYLLLTRKDNSLIDAGYTPNQKEVLKSVENDAGISDDIRDVFLNAPEDADIGDMADQLSGEIHADLPGALQAQNRAFTRYLRSRVTKGENVFAEHPLWITLNGYRATTEDTGNTAQARLDSRNINVGTEWELPNRWRLGAALRYADSKYKVDARGSRADSDSFLGSVYAEHKKFLDTGDLRLFFGATLGTHDVDAKRQARYFGQTLTSSYQAKSAQLFFELGYELLPLGKTTLEPYFGASWNTVKRDSFREHGGSAALRAGSAKRNNFATELGLRATVAMKETASLEAELYWQHTFGSTDPQANFAFTGGNNFLIKGAPLAKDALGLYLGAKLGLRENLDLSFGYDGLFSSKTKMHSASVNLTFKF